MPPPPAMSEFAGKRLVVTGGDSALGIATARAFMQRGAHVILVGADAARMAEARAALGPVRLGPLTSALDTGAALAQALDAAGGPVAGVVCLPHGPSPDAARDRAIAEGLAAAFPARRDPRHVAQLVLCGPAAALAPALARALAPAIRVNGVGIGQDPVGSAALPLGRAATVEEIAGVIRFLCSVDAGHVTGQVIAVDGGQSLG